MEEIHALAPVIVLLLSGIAALTLMRPLRMSPIVGYLLAGILIGPHGLGLIEESGTTHLLAELGVVFLLFDIGLHFSMQHIWDARREILGLGPIQVLFCTVALAGLALLFGFEPGVALLIGTSLALSSTAVVFQVLAGYNQSQCPVGSGAISVLIFQDICAIFLLIFAGSYGEGSASLGATLGTAALKALGAFLLAILIAHFFATPVFRMLAKNKDEEIFTAAALLMVLATAAATGGIGLSLTLGAFLGGMIIAETPYRHIIKTEVKPFRGLLLGFFFITVGMGLNTHTLLASWWQVLLIVALMLSVKILFVFFAALALRSPTRTSLQLGFLLSQGSEFAFVVFSVPGVAQALGADLASVLISAVALSMALTPPLAEFGHRFADRIALKKAEARVAEARQETGEDRNVIVLGMGPIGRTVADALEAHEISYLAVEMRHDRFIQANTDGYPVVFGDLADLRLMETVEMAHADTLVITEPRLEVAKEVAPIAKQRYPNLRRLVSVKDEERARPFRELSLDPVIDRSFPPGLDLSVAVLMAQNVSDEKIQKWMQRQQARALDEKAELEPFAFSFQKA